jgi:hypothetical protein
VRRRETGRTLPATELPRRAPERQPRLDAANETNAASPALLPFQEHMHTTQPDAAYLPLA